MCVPNTFLIKVLFLLKILNCGSLSLKSVFDLLVLSEQGLLFLLKAADILLHSNNLRIEFVHGALQFLITVFFVSKVVFHVLVHSVNILFLVKDLVLFRGACHESP